MSTTVEKRTAIALDTDCLTSWRGCTKSIAELNFADDLVRHSSSDYWMPDMQPGG